MGAGYPLTGILADLLGFRFAFWFAALFLITTILVVWRVVPAGPDEQAPRSTLDVGGVHCWSDRTRVAAHRRQRRLPMGVELCVDRSDSSPGRRYVLTAWCVVELRTAYPLINLRVLRNGDVLVANSTAIGLGAAMYIGLSIGSLIAQAPAATGYGIALPLFWAGFVMLPLSVASFGANRLVARSPTGYA